MCGSSDRALTGSLRLSIMVFARALELVGYIREQVHFYYWFGVRGVGDKM